MGKSLGKNLPEEDFFNQSYTKALTIDRYFCSDPDLAQEVAQMTTIKLYLKQDKIRKPEQWIYQVARNYAFKILKDQKKSKDMFFRLNRKLEEKSYLPLIEHPDLHLILSEIPQEFINKSDKEIAEEYFLKNSTISTLSKKFKTGAAELKEKLYHLRQEIVLYLKFTSSFKVISPVSGTRLNRNIMNFIRKLKESLETRDFTLLSAYCKDKKSLQKLKDAKKISHFKNYEISWVKPGIYNLITVYITEEDYPYIILFKVTMKDYKKIRIISEPVLPDKIMLIPREQMQEEDKILGQRKQDGSFIHSQVEIGEIVKKYKTEELYNRNKAN